MLEDLDAIDTGPDAVGDYSRQVLAVMCEAANTRGGVTTLGEFSFVTMLSMSALSPRDIQ